jgi:hypothetical protein
MRRDHRLEQADARRQASTPPAPTTRQQVRPEENRTERSGVDAVTQVEPVGGEALDDEAAAERVEREERRKLGDHAA